MGFKVTKTNYIAVTYINRNIKCVTSFEVTKKNLASFNIVFAYGSGIYNRFGQNILIVLM